jgi:hypothetical protein
MLFDNVFGNNPPIPITNNSIKNNLFYQNTGGDIYFYYTNPALQTLLGNYYATASYNSNPLAAIPGNTVSTANPMFVNINFPKHIENINNFDFHLQSTSPAINSGVFLTTTTSMGTGSVIQVTDAGYFIDGFGITNGDVIQLQGQSQTATINSINYTTNTITVDGSLTWTSGLGVSLAYSGTAPDIGAYEYNSATSIDSTLTGVPTAFELYQNYPNPFNPTTNIGFRIVDGGFISLKVYDILGNEVATVVDEEKPAGTYEVEFDASSLPSGIYFYQLQVSSFVSTKSMILIK